MIIFRRGRVTAVNGKRPGVSEILVDTGGREERALNYHLLTGPVSVGDCVLLNTTAVALGLGTGGVHFVAAVEGRPAPQDNGEGHIMKLRYTPFQVRVLAVEEEAHPGSRLYRSAESLEGMPVLVGSLHSMLPPAVAALKSIAGPGIKIFYLMTDGGSLPAWFSRIVNELREKGLVDRTVTCGHAFGGDYEAVNVYSGLLWARAAGADAAVVAMGPGIVGSSSEFGHTGLEQGEIVNAVNILGGRAIGIPRLSFADPRERHRGLSHHTRTALGRVALTRSTVPIPVLTGEKKLLVHRQLAESGISRRHMVVEVYTDGLPEILDSYHLQVTTMGRSIKDDPEFFHAAGAAGIYAAGLLKAGVYKAPDRFEEKFLPPQENDKVAHPSGEVYPVTGAV